MMSREEFGGHLQSISLKGRLDRRHSIAGRHSLGSAAVTGRGCDPFTADFWVRTRLLLLILT